MLMVSSRMNSQNGLALMTSLHPELVFATIVEIVVGVLQLKITTPCGKGFLT